jgi:predicted ATPase with chaperone activity
MESRQASEEELPEGESNDRVVESQRPPPIFRRENFHRGDGLGPLLDDDVTKGVAGESTATALGNVASALEADPPATTESKDSTLPKQPRALAEVGLSKAFLIDLTLKIMHYSGTPSAAQLMRRLGLGQSMVQQILTVLQEERLCEVLSQSDLFTGNYRYRLSERGIARAAEALERTRYAGPVPVTAEQYAEFIRAQQQRRQTPSRESIKAVLEEFVLAPEVADAVSRALYSGKAAMLHGPSGNGKTSILERYARSLDGVVLVPYALYAYGQVIRVFDPSIHEPVEVADDGNAVKDDGKLDRRWVLVRRPTVVLGSEIGQESLELAYDPQARFYQAPPHVKAQGGVLVVDDLGRQKMEARELMARWLIPVERGWDSLSLITGEKLTIPFDIQLLFATNRPLAQLADDALMRRILYKLEIPSPGPEEFAQILCQLCHQRNVQAPEGAIELVVERLYSQSGMEPRAAYARDLLEVIIEGAAYDGQEPVLDEESFARALKLFMSQQGGGEAD